MAIVPRMEDPALLYQPPLPAPYPSLSNNELSERISKARKALGQELVILSHHYQRPEIVALGDARGDSLKLAQFAAALTEAKYIVYCGVHFMAESADILKRGNQQVILPDLGAGCDMADMADADDVREAWASLTKALGDDDIIPVTYVNSTAALKAFVGEKDGVVCTSSNAEKIISWAFEQKRRIFFFPDQHLGRNTCKHMGIPLSEMNLWNPNQPLGGLSEAAIRSTRVFLWQGHCPVHMGFAAKQIDDLRARDPEIRIIVHPECTMDVVDKADFVGSTEYIVKVISEAPDGSKWAVGTEMNLVNRLALENPQKTVLSVNRFMCLCGTMNRIDLAHLAWALENITNGTPQNIISVSDPTRTLALKCLQQMLNLS